ncbi:unnamed protein product [Schistosoma margrebowiei]|uniref:Uncharacterized protein n=1 Tax=Schistosoma margrebowiei TaxID=48269 RepID=A0A183M1G5_9TREM|nr:unnamed protein product [Schistosoma margrebowiei]
MGLVTCYAAFLPSIHDIRAPLIRLLKKNSTWNWAKECNETFRKLKFIISSELLSKHYDPYMPIIVGADASTYGVGAVISHHFTDASEKAATHPPRTLTPAE